MELKKIRYIAASMGLILLLFYMLIIFLFVPEFEGQIIFLVWLGFYVICSSPLLWKWIIKKNTPKTEVTTEDILDMDDEDD